MMVEWEVGKSHVIIYQRKDLHEFFAPFPLCISYKNSPKMPHRVVEWKRKRIYRHDSIVKKKNYEGEVEQERKNDYKMNDFFILNALPSSPKQLNKKRNSLY